MNQRHKEIQRKNRESREEDKNKRQRRKRRKQIEKMKEKESRAKKVASNKTFKMQSILLFMTNQLNKHTCSGRLEAKSTQPNPIKEC